MNLKKLVILSCLIFTTSCSFNFAKENVDKVKEIFDDQLTNLYELCKTSGKEFLSELSFEKAEDGILKEKPRNPKEPLFNKDLFEEIIFSGFVIGIIVFGVWYFLLNIICQIGQSDSRG